MTIIFDEQEDNWWTCTSYEVAQGRPAIRLTLTTDVEPTRSYISVVIDKLKDLDGLIKSASARILENYSYEHYKGLGVSECNLVQEETPEAISNRAVLRSVWFMSEECDEFELSFELPWDAYHSYDVEFENGEAICCSVNG